jgi:hypothetical protein
MPDRLMCENEVQRAFSGHGGGSSGAVCLCLVSFVGCYVGLVCGLAVPLGCLFPLYVLIFILQKVIVYDNIHLKRRWYGMAY